MFDWVLNTPLDFIVQKQIPVLKGSKGNQKQVPLPHNLLLKLAKIYQDYGQKASIKLEL